MHVLILSGSRNTEGMTARCANAVARGLSKGGATSEMIFLPAMKIERCRQCEADGWGICRDEGRCIIDDDFDSLVKKLQSADIVIFATPVYFKELSESMRAFLDRLRRLYYLKTEQPFKGKPAIGVCVAGGGGGGAPSTSFVLESVLQWLYFSIINVVPVKRQNIDKKIPILEMMGKRLATSTDNRPSNYSVRLGIATRWLYKITAYIVYVQLSRWR